MFEKFIERYENTLVNDVIPFWEKNCIDKEYGGYFTSLDRDGSVYDYNKYMWMQWRIVYMFGEFYASEYKKIIFSRLPAMVLTSFTAKAAPKMVPTTLR